ncbi:Cytochrome c4 [Thalassocella blandensis]|nr:Cytochrome c4 [Thalassocella blandensis]
MKTLRTGFHLMLVCLSLLGTTHITFAKETQHDKPTNATGKVASPLVVIPEALQYCTVCHGTQFKGDFATGAPNLTGLPDWYLTKQLTAFKNKSRGAHANDLSGHEMRAAAESLDDATILLAVDTITRIPYIDSMPTTHWQRLAFKAAQDDVKHTNKESQTLTPSINNGKKLYATCAACHGNQAEGNPALKAPPLTGLNRWYMAKQLLHFKQGIRGNQSNDPASMQMKAAASILKSNQDIVDVVTYINALNQQELP